MLDEQRSDAGQNPDRFIAGAVKRPDGTMDLSKAVYFDDSALRAGVDRQEAEKAVADAAEWKKKMEVAPSVKPGTASMVYDRLRRSILTNQKMLSDDPGRADAARLVSRVESFRLQQGIIDRIMLEKQEQIREEMKSEGKSIETEEGSREFGTRSEITAADMQLLIDEHIKELRDILDKHKSEYLGRGSKAEDYDASRSQPILDRERELTEAEDLQVKMAQEAVGS